MFERLRLWFKEKEALKAVFSDLEKDVIGDFGGRLSNITDPTQLAQLVLDKQVFIEQMRLMQKAMTFHIPFPAPNKHDTSHWHQAQAFNALLMNADTMRRLREDLRAEVAARREAALAWVTPFIGIVGTVAGTFLGYFLGTR